MSEIYTAPDYEPTQEEYRRYVASMRTRYGQDVATISYQQFLELLDEDGCQVIWSYGRCRCDLCVAGLAVAVGS